MSKELKPDWVSPPGDTIMGCLRVRGIKVEDFAEQMGLNLTQVLMLLVGRLRICPQMAKKLPELLGGTENFWNNREERFRKEVKRLKLEEYYTL